MKNQKEMWLPVKGYEGFYEVSNLGRVKSLKRVVIRAKNAKQIKKETILKGRNNNRYLMVALYNGAVRVDKSIHIIVAESFLNYIPNKCVVVVDHINNNPYDNRLENLQIISYRENLSKDKKNKTSNYTGVTFLKNRNKFISRIGLDGKQIHLGIFNSEIDAHNAYQNKLKQIKNGNL